MLRKKTEFIFKIILFALLTVCSSLVKANDLVPSEVEYKFEGDEQIEADLALEVRAIPNTVGIISRYEKGALVSKNKISIDAAGSRTSSASKRAGKKKHLILIGGSVIFGAGLADEETIAHSVNTRSKVYEAYTLGYMGYQLPHYWYLVNQNKYSKFIPQKKGKAVLFLNSGSVLGVAGHWSQLKYISNWPVIKKNQAGIFEYVGSFSADPGFVNKLIMNLCLPFAPCVKFLQQKIDLTWPQIAKSVELIESIAKMYREQFEVEDFQVGWGDSSSMPVRMMETLTKIPIFMWRFKKGPDGHPDAEQAKRMANTLFDLKIVN